MTNKKAKLGLWDRIRAKRERGEKPAQPGDKDYPDSKNWKRVTSIGQKKQAGSPAWQRSAGKNEEGGLNAKGRASYNKATGGNLKAPVTESNPEGDRAKRQNSFCSRMCGMKRKNTGSDAKKDPDSRINKSLRKWNCKCSSAREFGSKFAELMLPSSSASSVSDSPLAALGALTIPQPPPKPSPKPVIDLEAASKNLTPFIQAESAPLGDSGQYTYKSRPLAPPPLLPGLQGKPLTRSEISKQESSVIPKPTMVERTFDRGLQSLPLEWVGGKRPEAPKAENPAPAQTLPLTPKTEAGSNWPLIAAGGGLSAAALLALYYAMKERDKPKKRREDDK